LIAERLRKILYLNYIYGYTGANASKFFIKIEYPDFDQNPNVLMKSNWLFAMSSK